MESIKEVTKGSKTQAVFSYNIKKARERKRLTQEDVAKKLGITAQTVSAWESQRKFPRIADIDALADLYGINVADFFVDKEGLNRKAYSPAATCAEFVNHLYALASCKAVSSIRIGDTHVDRNFKSHQEIILTIPEVMFTECPKEGATINVVPLKQACSNIAVLLMADKQNGGLSEDCAAIAERYIANYGNAKIPDKPYELIRDSRIDVE